MKNNIETGKSKKKKYKRKTGVIAQCYCCKKKREIAAHGLCWACYNFEKRTGFLPDHGKCSKCKKKKILYAYSIKTKKKVCLLCSTDPVNKCSHCGKSKLMIVSGLCSACQNFKKLHGILPEHDTCSRCGKWKIIHADKDGKPLCVWCCKKTPKSKLKWRVKR